MHNSDTFLHNFEKDNKEAVNSAYEKLLKEEALFVNGKEFAKITGITKPMPVFRNTEVWVDTSTDFLRATDADGVTVDLPREDITIGLEKDLREEREKNAKLTLELVRLTEKIEKLESDNEELNDKCVKSHFRMVEEGNLRAQFELENRRMLANGLGTFEWLGKGDVLVLSPTTEMHHGTVAQLNDRLKRTCGHKAFIVLPVGAELKSMTEEELKACGLSLNKKLLE